MKAIEAHAHLRRNAKGFDKIVESGIFEEIWLMDLSGVRLNGIEFATREEILQATKDFKGVVRAFGYLDLDGAAEQPDMLKEMGFVGLKPYKPHFPYPTSGTSRYTSARKRLECPYYSTRDSLRRGRHGA